MSLRIRLSRVGAKKQASYRIVVADSAAPRDGQAIATLGHYNPLTDPYTLKVDQERAVTWLKKGAQPSETAHGLLSKAGVISAFEEIRKGEPSPRQIGTEEAKAQREARPARTEPPRLVRPTKKEGAESAAAAVTTARKAAPAKKAPAKAGTAKAKSSRSTSTSKARPRATKKAN